MKPHHNNSSLMSLVIIALFLASVVLYACWVFGKLPQDKWQSAVYTLLLTFVLMFWDVVRRNGW